MRRHASAFVGAAAAMLGALACGDSADAPVSADGGGTTATDGSASGGGTSASDGPTGSTAGDNGGTSSGGANSGGDNGTPTGGGGQGGASPGGADGGGDVFPLSPDQITVTGAALSTCALVQTGALHCWGVIPMNPGPAWQVPDERFEGIAGIGPRNDVCGLDLNGALICLPGPSSNRNAETVIEGPFVKFDSGYTGWCALDAQGRVECAPGATNAEGVADERFAEVAVGGGYACGLRVDDGSVVCWGEPVTACGDRLEGAAQLSSPSGEFTGLAMNYIHACGLRSDGSVECWGAGEASSDASELDGCGDPLHLGQSVPPGGQFIQLSTGQRHTCGVRVDGTVACWGAGSEVDDQSGGLDTYGQSMPPPGTFAQVAAGFTHSCAMRQDRTVQCWGSDTGGRSTPPAMFQ